MKNNFFNVNTRFESDTYYNFEEKTANISLSDTVRSTEKKYLSMNGNGNYGFLDIAFYLSGLNNVTLDFGGAVITFCGKIQPFVIDECENISIKNVVIRYDRPFYSEFDIISNSNGKLRIRAKENFPCRVDEKGKLIPYSDTWEDRTLNQRAQWLQAFDKKTGAGRGMSVVVIGEEDENNQPHPTAVPCRLFAKEMGGDLILEGDIPKDWDDSMCVALAHEIRDKSSVAIYSSKDINCDNFRVLNGAGMGFLAVYTENIFLNNVKFFRDSLSYGVVTNAADAVHFVSCFGKITITDSIFEGMIDDAINVHSNFYHAESAEDDKFIASSVKTLHAFNSAFRVFAPDDVVAVYNGDTLEEKDRYTITEMMQIDEQHIEFLTDKKTDKICSGDMIENISAYPELIISNCKFNNANTHLRIQSRGKTVITDCETSLPICLTGDMYVWYEAGCSSDITIKNCTFFGAEGKIRIEPECFYTPSAPYYHKGIKILNNSFQNSNALSARNADGIEFLKNKTENGEKFDLEFNNCINVITDLNE